MPLVNPSAGNVDKNFKQIANDSFTATFRGNFCKTCKVDGKGHELSCTKVFALGDSYMPPLIGGVGDCIPVGRIEKGSFQHLKIFLEGQRELGFDPPKGSVFIVGLNYHLCVVGARKYWQQMDEFIGWASREFQVTIMPVFWPYPESLSDTYLLKLHQAQTELRRRYLSNFRSEYDWRYSLWSPLADQFKNLSIRQKSFPVTSFTVGREDEIILECPEKVWAGFQGDFGTGPPPSIESEFVNALVKTLRKSIPLSKEISPPLQESLDFGYDAAVNADSSSLENKPTIYLYGSSILKDAAEKIADVAATNEINVVSFCEGSNIDSMIKDRDIPKLANDKDTIVLAYLGNEFIYKANFIKDDGHFHYEKPRYHDDKQVNKLVLHLRKVIIRLRKVFSGKIAILGPIPRLIKKCCDVKDHRFPKNSLFTNRIQYTFMYNKFLSKHQSVIQPNVIFVPYDSIFPEGVKDGDLCDGIHLNYYKSDQLADFVAGILDFEPPKLDLLKTPLPSWTTWVETTLESVKKFQKCKVAAPTATQNPPPPTQNPPPANTAPDNAAKEAGSPADQSMDTGEAKGAETEQEDCVEVGDLPPFDDIADEAIEKEIRSREKAIEKMKAVLDSRHGPSDSADEIKAPEGEASGSSESESECDDESINKECRALENAINMPRLIKDKLD